MRQINRVLITGITGFVGSHLADYILDVLDEDIDIFGLVRWRSPLDNIKDIASRIYLELGDLEDMGSLIRILEETMPDAIFHLAAQSYVTASFLAPVSTLLPNIIGTCNLLEAVRILREKNGYDPVVHICSSSEVYGQVEKMNIPITEDCPFNPASPYAVSKVGEDMLAYQYFKSWGIQTIRTRAFTHTGPRRGEVFVVSTFAKQIAEIEKGLCPEVVQVGNLGSIRTFMDARDIVKAYWLMVNTCPAGEVYNIAGNETMTIGEMLMKLIRLSTNKKIGIETDSSRLRPSDVTLQVPSAEKFHSATGWEPEISLDTTLKDILDYWRARV